MPLLVCPPWPIPALMTPFPKSLSKIGSPWNLWQAPCSLPAVWVRPLLFLTTNRTTSASVGCSIPLTLGDLVPISIALCAEISKPSSKPQAPTSGTALEPTWSESLAWFATTLFSPTGSWSLTFRAGLVSSTRTPETGRTKMPSAAIGSSPRNFPAV